MFRSIFSLAFVLGSLLVVLPAYSAVKVPGFFGDHMVLQRDMPLPFWGWADANETVTVELAGKRAQVTADAKGEWKVELPKMAAGGPHQVVIKASNTITLQDVLIGEVWLCSGQSNMGWTVARSTNAKAEIAAAKYPRLRHITVPRRPSYEPRNDITAPWQVCSPETASSFTACGYFMGRELLKELDVPIGLINSSWGGTRIEPWTPPVGFAAVPALKEIHNKVSRQSPSSAGYQAEMEAHLQATEVWLKAAKSALASGKATIPQLPQLPAELQAPTGKINHQEPVMLYNGMIHALVGLPFRGAIWYQGESNHVEGAMYTEKKKALIGGWRKLWGMGDFPFYFVQIAPFNYGKGKENPSVLPTFWEAQEAVLDLPNTGMVVTSDIATINDIHPPNKQEVGRRLALLALNRTYGKTMVDSGPRFKSMAVEGGGIKVTFSNTAGGLKSRDGKPLTWFEVAGVSSGFQPAKAVIDGDSVILTSDKVAEPLAMRFAWNMRAEPNLANAAGLPCSAFRAGEIPRPDFLGQIEEAKDYTFALDLDLDRLGAHIAYDADNRGKVTGKISRIGYLVELQSKDGPHYVWVSCDAFTQDLAKIGIPTLGSGANFQQKVSNMTVQSNVNGIVNGSGLDGGNIEFWPNNYGMQNSANIPGADNAKYDWGDTPAGSTPDGYGCMQIHNHKAKQVLFAINQWKAGGGAANIGIGNNTSGEGHIDYTFYANGGSYESKRLRVFVK